jgi:aldehyde dehydrogenase (NAD+)
MTEVISRDQLYIGGRWVAQAEPGKPLDVVSPHTGQIIATAPAASPTDVDRAVTAAREAFDRGPWPRLTPAERIAAVRRISVEYGNRRKDMAALVTAQMGTPIKMSQLMQSDAPRSLIDATISFAEAFPWEDVRPTAYGGESLVRAHAVGVVAAIIPWNVPQVITIAKVIPALLAGCTVVIKPAPETPLDALLFADIIEAAGLPEGVVNVIPGGPETGDALVRHPGVDKVTFTGSTATGRRIGAICGEQLKRCSLELGGKSAAIVLDDADLGATAQGLRFASFINTGQACAAQTRVLVPRALHDDLVSALQDVAGQMTQGDPMDRGNELGPLVSARQKDKVVSYIDIGLQEGARLVAGGAAPPEGLSAGWYVPPTVFANATNDMRIAREEIFGPVLTVIPYDGGDDAGIDMANDSPYGLGGSVWTADRSRGISVASQVRTGTIGVNFYGPDFAAPFGGFKDSGIGREYGPEGLHEFIELQSITTLDTTK